MTIRNFLGKHCIVPELSGHIGIEREFFIGLNNNSLKPRAKQVLEKLNNPIPEAGAFSYELSACQIETQSLPAVHIVDLWRQQVLLEKELDVTLADIGLERLNLEVAPDDMPLDVYPDPEGRYGKIARNMPRDVLRAACQVTGTHTHIGMPSHEVMLKVYNQVIKHCDELCAMGDNSNGRRLELYKVVAPNYRPVPYESWDQYASYAKEQGFYENPRDCWHMIRMTIHGTIEFRCFGTTDSIDDVIKWAQYCRNLCLRYS